MKKYLLTIFTTENDTDILENISNSVSFAMKQLDGFIVLGGDILILFQTDQNKSELFDDLAEAINLDYYFTLTEINDVYTMDLPFNDFDEDIDDADFEVMSTSFPINDDEGNLKQLITDLGIRIVDGHKSKMNLDDILDKINLKGIDSLSENELQFLKNQ
jgi:hypothetical protein